MEQVHPMEPCPICKSVHPAAMPHDAWNLEYHLAFEAEHGRPLTWRDAIEHCSFSIQEIWRDNLKKVYGIEDLDAPADIHWGGGHAADGPG